MSFAKIAKELRIESGLSQMLLSKQLGISAAAIGFLELGKHEPNGATIIAYSKFFDVSTDYLLGLEDDFGERINASTRNDYTSEEKNFIKDLRKLTPGLRDILRTTLSAMLDDTKEDKNGRKSTL